MRYRNAVAALKVNLYIMNVVGHSLGGSLALELQENFPDRKFKSNTYGAPALSATAADNRFRNYFDPVSIMDRGTSNSVNVGFNPHTYSNSRKTIFQIQRSTHLYTIPMNNQILFLIYFMFYASIHGKCNPRSRIHTRRLP